MAEDFDISSFTWVKDEIDQALENVKDNFAIFLINPADATVLRFSQTHLNQVSGALDMVGLQGCQRFCLEIEKITEKLEEKVLEVNPEVIEKLTLAIDALENYLQALLDGTPDVPLRLFSVFQMLASLHGETVKESELFFPDISLRAPKDDANVILNVESLADYVADQRKNFQKFLLDWLRTAGAESLVNMRQTIDHVQHVQQQSVQKTLWWVVGAFIDAISQKNIAENANVKRLCRQIDQQLRNVSEGTSKATNNLLREILYYIALSLPETERITQVKNLFELEALLTGTDEAGLKSDENSEVEAVKLNQLHAACLQLVEDWGQDVLHVTGGLNVFLSRLDNVVVLSQSLNNPVLNHLLELIQAVVNTMEVDVSSVTDTAMVEVAVSLKCLEDLLKDYVQPSAKSLERLAIQTQRLQAVLDGSSASEALAIPQSDVMESEVLSAVVQQITEALKIVEQSLDTFFRNTSERSVLGITKEPLKQIIGAFDMLDMPLPTALARISAQLVNYWSAVEISNQQSNQTQFELVAESLSLLGFYAQELPHVRPETSNLLQATLAKLELQSSATSFVESQVDSTVHIVEKAFDASAAIIEDSRAVDTELLSVYLAEAEAVLASVGLNLQALRINPLNKNALSEVRRGYHTLKGSGRMVGLNALGDVAWAVEKLLNEILERKLSLGATQLAFIDKTSTAFTGWIAELSETGFAELNSSEWQQEADALIGEIEVQHELPAIVTEEKLPENNLSPVQKVVDATTTADRELLIIFLEEASELILQIGDALRAWQANPQVLEYSEALQRGLHTLKGSARTAGLIDFGNVVHDMEDRINNVDKTKVDSEDFASMFFDLDRISILLEVAGGESAAEQTIKNISVPTVSVGNQSVERRSQFLRLRADVLDNLINEAGEISITRARAEREIQGFKQTSSDLTESVLRLREYLRELEMETETQMQSRLTHVQEAQAAFDPLEFDRFTHLQELARLMAESVNDVATIQRGLVLNLDHAQSALRQQNRMNHELQHGLMMVRMVPFSLVSERLHRIVRQTARELNKSVEFLIEGGSVEIDRSVLDKIGAPLEHLLRNAVGHGLENPAQRKKQAKPECGKITLKVHREHDEIIITVADDGAGINLQRVREKAIQSGLLDADQEVTEQALLAAIFEPGVTTAANVTQISGRGVGLDAVRGDITVLGGRIEVSSTPDQGASFSIHLPVTLSVARVVLIRVGTQVFALPSLMVVESQEFEPAALTDAYLAGGVNWSGQQYPIHYFARLIGEPDQIPEEQNLTPLILLRGGTDCIALHVDEVLGDQEVVMKPVGSQLASVPGISGATVMGDGKIVLVVNPVQLASHEVSALAGRRSPVNTLAPEPTKPVVMVVDDSLTMRKVLARTLERENYQVLTAKDGLDALECLQETRPELILLDIEMPRMDGFEFMRILRNDPGTAHIPVIIISSRTAEKHRNLAETLGVNAFLGKPVHDEALLAQIAECLSDAESAVKSYST